MVDAKRGPERPPLPPGVDDEWLSVAPCPTLHHESHALVEVLRRVLVLRVHAERRARCAAITEQPQARTHEGPSQPDSPPRPTNPDVVEVTQRGAGLAAGLERAEHQAGDLAPG